MSLNESSVIGDALFGFADRHGMSSAGKINTSIEITGMSCFMGN